jgi:hypothetical protein
MAGSTALHAYKGRPAEARPTEGNVGLEAAVAVRIRADQRNIWQFIDNSGINR